MALMIALQFDLPPLFVNICYQGGFPLGVANSDKYFYSGKIIDEFDQEVLYPKLSYKMLVFPNFNKVKADLPTILDQWMYLMKHLDKIDKLPNYLDKRIFSCMFHLRVCF